MLTQLPSEHAKLLELGSARCSRAAQKRTCSLQWLLLPLKDILKDFTGRASDSVPPLCGQNSVSYSKTRRLSPGLSEQFSIDAGKPGEERAVYSNRRRRGSPLNCNWTGLHADPTRTSGDHHAHLFEKGATSLRRDCCWPWQLTWPRCRAGCWWCGSALLRTVALQSISCQGSALQRCGQI